MSGIFTRITSRISRSGDESSSSPTTQSYTRRREQVRRAQRTHRERRAKYLQGLEDEVAYLRARDGEKSTKLQQIERINQRLLDILQAHQIQIPSDILSSQAVYDIRPNELSADLVPDHGRFVNITDPQVATDIILHLEQDCLKHLHNRGEDNESGHMLQMQASMIQGDVQAMQPGNRFQITTRSSQTVSKSQVHEQLNRVIQSAQVLDLPGELTPVMCLVKLQQKFASSSLTKEQLEKLLAALLPNMQCRGFGAVIDEVEFHSILDSIVADQ